MVAGAAAQAPIRPAFDAVSIKPFVPTGPWHRDPQVDPQRMFLEGMTPEEMIVYAYQLRSNQLVGMPEWSEREYFQVSGSTDKPARQSEMLLMLQRALADRFQLAFTESNQVQPAYALVVAPHGPKLKPWTASTPCAEGVRMLEHQQLRKLPAPFTIPFVGCTISELVNALNRRGRTPGGLPVVDRTGLAGTYAMWVWERMGGSHVLPDGITKWDWIEPFDDAVQRELGLALVKTRAPYRVLRVTRIERPRAN